MTKLRKYQREGVRLIEKFNGRALLADPMGLGKSIQALKWAEWCLEKGPIVVICPASIKLHWQREASMHCNMRAEVLWKTKPYAGPLNKNTPLYIINYDILGKGKKSWLAKLKKLKPTLVIVDECFPESTIVETDKGPLRIGDVVNNRMPVKMACVDHSTDEVIYRPIMQYIKKRRDTRMVTIHHTSGKLVCTENHEIWTENRGYVEAKNLTTGDQLHSLRHPIHSTEQQPQEKILLTSLLHASVWKGEHRQETARCIPAHENAQSHEQPAYNSENAGGQEAERDERISRTERRQRQANQAGSRSTSRSRRGMESSAGHSHKTEEGLGISPELQSGRGQSRDENSRGDRREGTHQPEEAATGSQENNSAGEFRVVRVEIHEPSNGHGDGGLYSPDPEYVYCLAVEEHQNFFAEGVLVHNCHYLQSRSAKRTKAVKELCKDVPHIIMIGGTPMSSCPAEMFNVLNILCPEEFPSFFEYGWRYCGPVRKPWGMEYKGATNIEELHERLTKLCMIRRRKEDVLKDLPAKTRNVVTLELPDRKEYDLAEKDFINWLRRVSPEKARSAANAEYLVRRGYLHRLAGELKLKQCIEWVDNFLIQSDQKLILFGIHKKVIKPIFEHYKERAVLVDGSVTGEDRQKAVDGFTNNKNKRLFVGNMVAAGVGWNGTAASDVVFVELTWTPGLHTQAEDRPHRIGQKLPVFCHYLVAENTVEEDLCALLQRKQNTVSSILDGAEISGLELLTLMDNAMMKRHNKGIMPHGR